MRFGRVATKAIVRNSALDLASAASTYLGDADSLTASLLSARGASRVYDIVQSETHTEPLLATFFWQIFAASPSYLRHLAKVNVSPLAAQDSDAIVVGHERVGGTRYDLVVLDPGATSLEPRALSVQPSRSDLQRGWEAWRDQRHPGYRAAQPDPRSPQRSLQLLVDSVDPTLAYELAELQDFRILVLPPPRIDQTASRVPTPAWSVAQAPGLPSATAGVVASNRQGHLGVTAALHGLRQAVARVVPGATQALVGGVNGVVDSIDEISDSVFIALGPDSPNTFLPGPAIPVAGPLSGLSPRERDMTTFTVASGPKQAYVTGWDKDIPFVRPFSQLRVYTTPATSPGDSGVALLDGDGRVVGFAFYRTGLGEPIEYSAWVWADSVYHAHGLQ